MSSTTAEKGRAASTAGPVPSESKAGAPRQRPGSPLAFFAIFLPFCAVLAKWSIGLHYALPEPVHELRHPHTGLPQFSEAKALDYVRHYSEDIGYRIVGTPEMTRTVAYTLDVLEGLKKEAAGAPNVEIEISHQIGAGHHLFEFMGKKVWKKYLGLENVVVRLSNGTAASKANAILVNAHLDSTLPSPGAADDAAGVGVMLEALRVMSQTPDIQLGNAIIFLFNGAEESLQDASHLFITQHEWRSTVRAVVNLEAAGTAGAEMLFQATSTEMLKAYSHVPRPNGAVIATEVFGTGLILSDTDFRQFEQYGGLTGLDMALVKDSYKYHTRLDRAQYIERGALQHFGDNVLAILVHLAGTTTANELRNVTKARETVYFAMLGGRIFVCIQANYVLAGYAVLWLACVALIWTRMQEGRRAGYAVALLSLPGSLVSALLTANLTAVTMAYLLDKPLSYFRREWWSVLLYGTPALLGIILCQLVTARIVYSQRLLPSGEGALEHSLLYAALIYNSTFALVGHSLGMLSSYCWGIAAAALFVTLVINDFVIAGVRQGAQSQRQKVSILAYLLAQVPSMIAGPEGLMSFLDVVVPLTGRMGVEAPGDIITASLVSGVGFLVVPTLPALCHRWGSAFLAKVALVFTLAIGVIISVFASSTRPTFDAMHPKRVLCLYMENITSHDLSLHMANIDGAGTVFKDLVHASTAQLGMLEKPVWADIGDSIPDWDIIYPVSQFLHSYKIPLPAWAPAEYVSPFQDSFKVEAIESRLNAVTQTRYVRLALRHPGIIWTVMAFNGDVVQWDLPEPAERGDHRHHVKEVSGAGVDTWELSMTLKLTDEQFAAAQRNAQRRKGQRPKGGPEEEEDRKIGGVRVDFSGLDVNRMWHHRENQNRTGMEFLERLDRALPDWTDPMLLTAVAAVEYV